jgi:hypothetical protein
VVLLDYDYRPQTDAPWIQACSDDDQQTLLDAAQAIEAERSGLCDATPVELAAIDRGLDEARGDRFASDREAEAVRKICVERENSLCATLNAILRAHQVLREYCFFRDCRIRIRSEGCARLFRRPCSTGQCGPHATKRRDLMPG